MYLAAALSLRAVYNAQTVKTLLRSVKGLTAKEYLEQIKELDRAIKAKEFEIYKLECLATSTTAGGETVKIKGKMHCVEKVQTSGISDKVGNLGAKIADLQKELEQEKAAFVDQIEEHIRAIEQLKAVDALLYYILHRRYVAYCSFKKISKEICYSYDYTRELHIVALRKFAKIMNF